MFTLIVFLIVISVLVFVHELGHFVMAKRAGMKVEEFGFGFPPRLWGKKYRGTLYSINLIPFGGFVRIFGEQGEHRHELGSFGHGTFLQKMGVIVAGVVMNLLLAAVLLMGVNFLGLRVGLFDAQTTAIATDKQIDILQVEPSSPAAQAGLRPLDQIVGFQTPQEVQQFAFSHAGQRVTLTIHRDGQDLPIALTLRQPSEPTQGPIGISLALTGVVRYPWYQALWRGVADTAGLFIATIVGYWQLLSSLFTTGHLGSDISGPIGIASLTGQAARIGFNYLLQFVAMISVNLAVLNILPFPALDGGRAAIIIAEKIRGKALSDQIENTINSLGFIILLALMVAVTVRDIVHFF